ncbi:MAG TPA: acetate/propionate family kinase [Candidatus Methylomirabilis sp.]|nr:acetate/propionate family kinase [Candidatus Methylomirabilis sp.]
MLTINGGSSSVKFALFGLTEPPVRMLSGEVERIGLNDTVLNAIGADGHATKDEPFAAADLEHAGGRLIDWLGKHTELGRVAAVGHRVVHGGPHYAGSRRITPQVIEELKRIAPLDPDHLPGELSLIQVFLAHFPRVPQVACFDTAFHHGMPRVAQLLPLPRRYDAAGVRRYGFHGLSYSYLLGELARVAGPEAARGRLVLAHLGSGASLAAVRQGKCVDTTMAFTPTAGLVMGTRSGDLDPGVLLYLMRSERMTAEQIDDLVNRQSGLLGVSDLSPDMKELLAREPADPNAAEAVELFCYQTRKYLAAMAAAAGGVDTLVFAGGIGERSAPIRARICAGLEFLGVHVDSARNAAHSPVISPDDGPVTVRVIPTDEETTIARETLAIVGGAA